MKNAIKTYNMYHSIWDTLLFGLAAPIVIIIVHFFITLGLVEGATGITLCYTMIAEIFRDYFSFNGAYSSDSHNTILRSSFYGKRTFVNGIMQEHARSFVHYVLVIGICSVITAFADHYDPYYIPIKVIVVLIAYTMNTLAVNVVRYFGTFTIYPIISTPFVILTIIPVVFLTALGIRFDALKLGIFMLAALVLGIIVTIISYLHASHSYDKSFLDVVSRRS